MANEDFHPAINCLLKGLLDEPAQPSVCHWLISRHTYLRLCGACYYRRMANRPKRRAKGRRL